MTFRKSTLLLIALAAFAALVGCSSNNSTPFSLTLNQFPTSVLVNSSTPVTANVTSGSVTWSCTATSGTCGTFSSATTTSGVATNYIAPVYPAQGVVISATSSTNPNSVAATPSFNVTAATLAAGASYVYSLSGFDINGPYTVSGAFTVGANGTSITGGEQDFVDPEVAGTTDGINPTGSSLAISADNNLTITLVICSGTAVPCTGTDTALPSGGTEVLTGTVAPTTTNSKILITEFDSSATSSGELDAQIPSAAGAVPAGGYAFELNGLDSDEDWVSLGGIINVDDLPLTVGGPATVGTISGAGSEYDLNDSEAGLFQGETISSGTVSTPDSHGRVVFTLNNPQYGTFVVAGYIVDSSRIRLVENFTDGFGGTTGGTALSQPTADVGLFSATNVSGNTYVVGLNGVDSNFALQTAGQFTLNADNSVSGFINYNDTSGEGIVLPATSQAPAAITGGTWAIDAFGTVSLTGITDGTADFNLQLYIDGNGNLVSISLDDSDVLSGRGWQQSGTGAFTAGSFTGAYAMGATGWELGDDEEFDAVGEVVADGVGTFTGFADYNWFGDTPPTYPNAPVSGTFVAASSGVFTGTITGLDADNCQLFSGDGAPGCTADAFSFYLIDATGDNIAIETDTTQVTLGYFTQK